MADAPVAAKEEAKKESALDIVKEGLVETLGLTQAEVDELPIDAQLSEGRPMMDELDKVELTMWLEERINYSGEISDDEMEKAKTMADWVKLVEAKRK